MLNRIFLSLLLVATLTVGFFNAYSYSWLRSIGEPSAAFDGFTYYLGLSWNALWISSALLLVTANAALWKTRSSWTMWATFVFYTFFVVARYFWLEPAGASFRVERLGAAAGYNVSVLLGIVLVFLFGVIVFFNQYLSLRLFEKMYPAVAEEAPAAQPEPAAE